MKALPDLRATWLGSWKAPWAQGRGRRWGDAPWALQAIAQAWLLGGREGLWPTGSWEARRPQGPRPREAPRDYLPHPDPRWVSLLRHGSPGLAAERRGAREDELRAWCWASLLAGDGGPWMASGTLLLDRPTRTRWIPLLGAVDGTGRLHLPPFLDDLVPGAFRQLPEGWWPALLGNLDGEGRLLPEGPLPLDLPWEALRPHLEAWALEALPPVLEPHRGAPWLHALPGRGWMIDPRIRAWGRGRGDSYPPPALALGDPPTPSLRAFLDGKPPLEGPPWSESLLRDLQGSGGPIPLPPPSGDPVWDRVRVRWDGELPPASEGYPPWGDSAHPCADPFHWMAEGRRAYLAQDMEGALRAFTWGHAHFERLGSPFWSRRAASNAAQAALYWGDLPAMRAWRRLEGPLGSPYRELAAAQDLLLGEDWPRASAALRRLLSAHPDLPEAWHLLGEGALVAEDAAAVREALPHVTHPDLRRLLEASLGPLDEAPPPDMLPEQRLVWAFLRARHAPASLPSFWQAWEACPSQLTRLDAALPLLERHPEARESRRLLALQSIAERADSQRHRERLRALWPAPPPALERDAQGLLREALARQTRPLWLTWGPPEEPPRVAGRGDPPPEGLLLRLHQGGGVPPFEAEGRIWWGFPLRWEGAEVGRAMVASAPGETLEAPLEAALLAPWVAALAPAAPAPTSSGAEGLLWEGSEPMASVMGELARVAPSELAVLILGPTGSGKELVARELHRRSGRPGPLVPLNCSAFTESLLESELFGHTKGAFTGADRDRKGALESAHGGTVFLDEIADLSPRLQSLLLRVLQEREIRKVGSDRAVRVDVRFLAATHKPLEECVRTGLFRKDLYFRLQGTVLRLPSLGERAHELPWLLPRLWAQVAREARREPPPLSPGLALALARLPWPGNFRELRHALERALLRCGEGPLRAAHFPELEAPAAESRTWEEATRAFQRRLLLDTLRRFRFRAAEAAEALGLARPALYAAARRLGIDLLAERAREGRATSSDPS